MPGLDYKPLLVKVNTLAEPFPKGRYLCQETSRPNGQHARELIPSKI